MKTIYCPLLKADCISHCMWFNKDHMQKDICPCAIADIAHSLHEIAENIAVLGGFYDGGRTMETD